MQPIQQNNSVPIQEGRDTTSTPNATAFNPADTINKVYYFYLKDFELLEVEDEFKAVHRINPVLSGDFQHQYLGNFGAPHYALMYEPRLRRGFDMGYHHYDGYLTTQKDVPFYNVEKPHTDALFSAATQEDAFINVQFSSNTLKRSNSYISYKRISHIGSFTHQQVRHTNYVTSTYWRSKKDNYMAFFSWAGNTIKQKNNGGILIDTLLGSDLYRNTSRKLIPVNLESAQSEYDNHEITVSQYFSFAALKRKNPVVISETIVVKDSLGVPVDTIIKKKRPEPKQMIEEPEITSKAYLSHQFSYKLEQIKFFDNDVAGSSDFYGDFLVNQRGLRHYITAKKYENQFNANLELEGNGTTFLLQPGLTYALYFINQEPEKLNQNDLFVTARLQTKLKEFFNLDANGQIGIGSNAGDYTFSGKLSTGLKDKANIQITAMQQLYQPTLIQKRLLVSHIPMWDNNSFKRTLETNLGGQLEIPFLHLKIGAGYHLFNSYIYFDESAKPAQATQALNILQVYGKHKLKYGKFHLVNELAFQVAPTDFIPLPNVVSRHNWYYQNYFFKAKSLLGQIGIEARYNSGYKGNSYMPVSGQFYLQDEVDLISFYPIMDVYVNAKVKRFYMFLKAENVVQPIIRKSYLTSVYHPGRDLFIRFGISWKLID